MSNPTMFVGVAADSNSPVPGVSQIVIPEGAGKIVQAPISWSAGIGGGNAGGHFRAVLRTGKTTGLTAGQPIASLRWTDATHYFVLLGLKAMASIDTAFGTAQLVDLQAFIARSYSAVDSGGTASIPAAAMSMVRDKGGVTMTSSLVNDMRVATTGTLTAGTRTLDTLPFADAMFNQANGLGAADSQEIYRVDPADHPIVLGVNEGLVFQVPTAQGATGKVIYSIMMKWAEVLVY